MPVSSWARFWPKRTLLPLLRNVASVRRGSLAFVAGTLVHGGDGAPRAGLDDAEGDGADTDHGSSRPRRRGRSPRPPGWGGSGSSGRGSSQAAVEVGEGGSRRSGGTRTRRRSRRDPPSHRRSGPPAAPTRRACGRACTSCPGTPRTNDRRSSPTGSALDEVVPDAREHGPAIAGARKARRGRAFPARLRRGGRVRSRTPIRAMRGNFRWDMNRPVSSTSIQRRSWRKPRSSTSHSATEIAAAGLDGVDVDGA